MKNKDFDQFEIETLPELASLLKALKSDIDDDMRETPDDEPYIQITISTDNSLSHWSYQTGDNSFTGNCYGDPYWGIGTLTRDSDCNELAREILEDLSNVIEFED